MIDLFKLEEVVIDLIMDFQAHKEEIKALIAQVAPDFDKEIGKTIIYADMFCGNPSARNHRFSLFVMMYEECEVLKNDDSMAYDLFMTAYVNSSNIHKQLQGTPFDIRGFLQHIHEKVQIDTMFNEISRPFYDQLPGTFEVYRGLSKAEKDDGRLGVSWTLDESYAERYLYLKDNEVEGDVGYVASMTIEKKDVISVQYEYHNNECYFEILTLKDEGAQFREVVIKK